MTLWFLARAAGFVAVLAATVAVSLGALGSSTRPRGRGSLDVRSADRRIVMQLVHRSAAVLTLAMLTLHAGLLVLDSYVVVSLPGALTPFTAGYRPVALGFGTLAAYAFVVVAASGALRGRLTTSARAVRAWRALHLGAYVAWVLSMAHGVLAGTDTGTWWSWSLYATCACTVAAAATTRVVSDIREQRSPLPAARRRLVSGGHR
jgi:methionine sulfoxide reductase heme-binding subunit